MSINFQSINYYSILSWITYNLIAVLESVKDCPVFVNDVLVREQTELCFGDRLSLGDKGNVFLFTVII